MRLRSRPSPGWDAFRQNGEFVKELSDDAALIRPTRSVVKIVQ